MIASKFILKIIIAVILPSATLVGGIIAITWYEWFTLISKPYDSLIFIPLVLPFVIWLLKILKKSSSSYHVSHLPRPEIWRILYDGVHWKIAGSMRGYSKIIPDTISAQIPPICPDCKTELEEKENITGWKWKCPNCRFKKQSRISFYDRVHSITKIAKGMFERGGIKLRLINYIFIISL